MTDHLERLDIAPPSTRTVYQHLRDCDGETVTCPTLVEATDLAESTVRVALDDLRDRDLADRRPCLDRQALWCYRLQPTDTEARP